MDAVVKEPEPVRPSGEGCWALLVGLAALGVYLRTLAPSIFWGDSPELTTAAYFAGVPHPTGYPLYMLLAHPFVRYFPAGNPAFRMNLLSALAAALAVTLAFGLCRRFTRHPLPAALAALLFAFGRTFWSQAVIAEVYAFHLLLVTAVLLLVLAWDHHGDRRLLWAAAGVYGLGFTHHLMSVLLLPGLLLFVLAGRRRGEFLRELPRTVPLFLLPLALYLYLPLAALRDSPANWSDPRNWGNFVEHVTGRQYRGWMFQADPALLARRLAEYAGPPRGASPGWLWTEAGPALPLLAASGLLVLLYHRSRALLLTLPLLGATLLYAFGYRIHDVEVYYLPGFLVLAVWAAAALDALPRPRPALPVIAAAGLLLLPVPVLASNWKACDRSGSRDALAYGRAVLSTVGPGAVIFGGGERTFFPLLYVQHVERRRPDVVLVSLSNLLFPSRVRLTTRLSRQGLAVRVPPCYGGPGKHHGCLLEALVADNVGKRAVYYVGLPEAMRYDWTRRVALQYHPVRRTNLPLVQLSPAPPLLEAPPPAGSGVGFLPAAGGPAVLELTGYVATAEERDGASWLRLRLGWRTDFPAAAAGIQVRALVADAAGNHERERDGSPRLQHVFYPGYRYEPGAGALPAAFGETLLLHVPPGIAPAPRYLWVAALAGGRYLPAAGTRGAYVRLGPLPAPPPPNRADTGGSSVLSLLRDW